MKNQILAIILFFFALTAKSQTQFGVQASGVLSNASLTDESDQDLNKKLKAGFAIGIFAEVPLSESFSLKPSFNFMQKGAKIENEFIEEDITVKQEMKANLNYLELPILAIYKVNGTNGKLFLGAGPSFGYGISGKIKGEVSFKEGNTTSTESFSIDAFKDEEDDGGGLSRFDLGVMGVAGYALSEKIALQLSYLYGLSNIANTSDSDDNEFKNRNILLSLSYKI
ncbi:porin family protein [Mariniflexile gromovii]|uniref:PorT family protein n=1 Tax=Mariniflexile gromovii TaxID=362523 RepID=A0ABS4BRC8_9FLAO|nr:porin family protein [Mariniflexile gromovii]MBP0902667.1 PorT family protein [Mariniflexile gromovii]